MQAIIEAAARILESGGRSSFNTNAVAVRAGVSIGTLYQYFPDKDALVGALISRETSSFLEAAEASLAATTGSAALDILVTASVMHQFRRPALALLLDREEGRLPTDPATQMMRTRFRQIVSHLVRRPDLPSQLNPVLAADDVVAIIQGMIDASGDRSERDPGALVTRVKRAVLGYLETRLD